MTMSKVLCTTAVLIVMLGITPALAQQTNGTDGRNPLGSGADHFDSRWLPWLGCWQLQEEQFDSERDSATYSPDRTFVCVAPSKVGSGITLRTISDQQILIERELSGDAIRKEVSENDCLGWEYNEWTTSGYRLFTKGELICGDGPGRTVNGLSFLANPSTWVDIQLVASGEHRHLEIRRYQPVSAKEEDRLLPDPSSPSGVDRSRILRARRESSTPLSLPDVREAAEKAPPRVVEAMLSETRPRFSIDAETLMALDDAGVEHQIIDLLVALAYPEHFSIEERRSNDEFWSGGGGYRAYSGYGGGFYDPIWYNGLYPYYYTPLGYNSWNRYYSPYFYGGYASPFILFSGYGNNERVPTGQLANGTGYTRVTRRGADGTGRLATSSAKSGGATGVTSGRSGGGSSNGGRATPGGYRGGGRTSGGTRTAVPRR